MIFSAPMIRALLDGTKTETRRVIKPAPAHRANLVSIEENVAHFCDGDHPKHHDCAEHAYPLRLPCTAGDRLWVREAWRTASVFDEMSSARLADDLHDFTGSRGPNGLVRFEADGRDAWGGDLGFEAGRLRAAQHLPRSLSRLTLLVEDVRVERLHEIDEAGARAEGILYVPGHGFIGKADLAEGFSNFLWARLGFEIMWNDLHGPDAWAANPWVAVIRFRVVRQNIDAIETEGGDG